MPPAVSRALSPADLASLLNGHPAPKQSLRRIRDSHHAMARLVAEGRPGTEISALTGFTPSSISILKNDPAFAELVAFYRAEQRDAYASLADRMALLSLDTIQELQDRLANAPETFSIDDLQEQVKLLADRTGHGPQSRSDVRVTHVGFAERLEEARRRAEGAKLIEHSPAEDGPRARPVDSAEASPAGALSAGGSVPGADPPVEISEHEAEGAMRYVMSRQGG